jgi:hypothetical protein
VFKNGQSEFRRHEARFLAETSTRTLLLAPMIWTFLSLLLLLQAPTGSIRGSVIAADTGQPLVGITVFARSLAPVAPPATPASPASTITNDKGDFEFSNLSVGDYSVRADTMTNSQGYSRQAYGAAKPGSDGYGNSKPVSVSAGKTTDRIVIPMSKGATISGRVLGANGQPFVDAEVRIHRARFNETGTKQFIGEGMPIKVNDRGEYRFFGIDPGIVYLHAGPQIRLVVTQPGVEPSPYAEATYYPRAASLNETTPIEVRSGLELSNIDLQLLPRPVTYSIRGRIIDSRTGQPPDRNIQPMLVPRDREAGNLRGYLPEYGPDGTFTANGVVEGEYWISTALRPPMAPPLPGQPFTPPAALVAFHRITVRGADINGLVFTFVPSVNVSGVVRLDGTDGAVPPGVHVQLDLVRNGSFTMNMELPPKAVAVASDGTFTVPEVPQGEYRLRVSGLPKDIHIRDAKVGNTDVLVDPFTIGSASSGRVEIVLSRASARIQGRLVNQLNEPVSNAEVVLIPDKLRKRTDLYRAVKSDATGRFEIADILSGDYKAFAWQDLLPFQYFDEKLLASSEDRGEAVHVEDGETRSITVYQIRK